jgi:hypothetical protein
MPRELKLLLFANFTTIEQNNMGRYTLFDNFLMKGSASSHSDNTHIEVLKEMKNLGDDDDRLLVPALIYLGSKRGERARKERMEALRLREPVQYRMLQQLDENFTQRSVGRMLELALLLRTLRGHNYNIFEYCFLASRYLDIEAKLLLMAAFSLIAQILLLIILMYYNMRDITNVTLSKDWGTIVVVVITTVFFAKLAYAQWKDSYDFNALFWHWKAGYQRSRTFINKQVSKKALLVINFFVNGVLGAAVVLFNIFFLLISEDVNDAIVNSLSLFFILEMDDTLTPDWDEMQFDNRIALTVFRYHGGDSGGDFQVEITPNSCCGSEGLEDNSSAAEDFFSYLLQSDEKVYFVLADHNDILVVGMYLAGRDGRMVEFGISGANGRDFFDNIKQFSCVKRTASFVSPVSWGNSCVIPTPDYFWYPRQ